MKKIIYSVAVIASTMFASTSFAQLIDEKDVTITMDLQPILQLNMSTSDQLEFVFDDISDYVGGITKYAATVLKVSSTVSWDLYAVGNSSRATTAFADAMWDQQVQYGDGTAQGAIDDIPLSALELHQFPANPAAGAGIVDYSAVFAAATTGAGAGTNPSNTNCVWVNKTTATDIPDADERYIAGSNGTAADFQVAGGSYLTETGASSDYYYTIDYRIIPGLPAIFPNAADDINAATFNDIVTVAAGTGNEYAQPGVYTMYVQYILTEDL